MSQEPRRRRFQFHLSTGVVLMLVAGGLIWRNLQVETGVGLAALGPVSNNQHTIYRVNSLGWPYGFLFRFESSPQEAPVAPTSAGEVLGSSRGTEAFELTALLDDLFVAVLILGLAFGTWEGILRVRAFLTEQLEEIESGG